MKKEDLPKKMRQIVAIKSQEDLADIIPELERLYRIQNGGNRGNQYTEKVAEVQNAPLAKTQEDLAKQLQISKDALKRYKKLAELIPELEDFVETGMITPTTALALSRQRGVDNSNPVKLGRCIKELERLYGIEHDGDRKSKRQNVALVTQEDLAEQLKMSTKQLQRYKKLTELIPELERLYGIQNGGNRGNQYTEKVADGQNDNLPKTDDLYDGL